MAEHNDELGFFFCENCGHVQKSDVPYEKLTEECSHCHFSTWIWEPKEDRDAVFSLRCNCNRKIEGIVGDELAADVLHCDCGKTWFVSCGTAAEETEYTHTRTDRLAALERLYTAHQQLKEICGTDDYDGWAASRFDVMDAVMAIERLGAEAK